MHEYMLSYSLLNKVQTIARDQEATKITAIRVQLGALTALSPEQLRETFAEVSKGSIAEGAVLEIDVRTDPTEPLAQEVLVESIEVEEEALPGATIAGSQ